MKNLYAKRRRRHDFQNSLDLRNQPHGGLEEDYVMIGLLQCETDVDVFDRSRVLLLRPCDYSQLCTSIIRDDQRP